MEPTLGSTTISQFTGIAFSPPMLRTVAGVSPPNLTYPIVINLPCGAAMNVDTPEDMPLETTPDCECGTLAYPHRFVKWYD